MSSPLKNVIAVAALFVAASCTPQASDGPDLEEIVAVDPDEAALFAGTIELGVPTSGELNNRSPYDYYLIQPQAGTSAQAAASSPSGDDLALIAYKRVRTRLGYRYVAIDSNDNCGLGVSDPCLFLDFDGSRYLVLVTTATTNDGRAASYELTVAKPCGTRGLDACSGDQFCDFPDDQCAAADVPGLCIQRPQFCTREYVPVCACGTDEVFSNKCTAEAAGYDVVECPASSCSSNADCGAGQVCDLSANSTCGPDIVGECRDIDVDGFCPAVYMPVCGCDGKTYGNECERIASGAALAYEGECEPVECDPDLICGQALTCVDGNLYPTTCGPANCDSPIGACQQCDPDLICAQVLTCVDGNEYPTACGPANCDEPIGPCEEEPACDPGLICGQALTCFDGNLYPTTCGPANCDSPIGACE